MMKRIRTSRLPIRNLALIRARTLVDVRGMSEQLAHHLQLVAEVLVGLATDTTVYLSRRGEALKVNKLTFTIRAIPHGTLGSQGALCFLIQKGIGARNLVDARGVPEQLRTTTLHKCEVVPRRARI